MKKSLTSFYQLIMLSLLPSCLAIGMEQVDVNARDGNTDTPLHVAIYQRKKDKVERLLAHSDLIKNAKNRDGNTPLHYAAMACKDLEIVQLIIDAGMALNAQNNGGQTPLHLVSINDRAKVRDTPIIIQKLIVAGADPSIEDINGRTPLEAAIIEGRVLVVMELAKHTKKPPKPEFVEGFERCKQKYQAR